MRKYDNQLEDFFGVSTDDPDPSRGEGIRETIVKRLSLRSRLRLLPRVLSFRERYTVLALLVILAGSLIAIPVTSYYHFTVSVPADGGKIVEGTVGEPRLVNPLLAPANEADRDLVALIYSGLLKYNDEGKLVPDLAKTFPEITSDGLSYSVTIREDAYWHDGVPVTADDVLFTIQAAQNADFGAATNVRASWLGVTVEKASERVVIFRLKNKYAQFPTNLTLGILPKHLWQDIKPINFSLSELNTKPVGSGPYQFKSLVKDDRGTIHAYRLKANEQFYRGRPHIDEFEFRFYDTEDELIQAFNDNDITSIGTLSGSGISHVKFRGKVDIHRLKMPRYFALFFNQSQSRALADKNVRLALNYATDRIAIVNEHFDGNAFLINSPLLGGILDINANVRSYDYDQDQAISVLETGGWDVNEEGIRERSSTNPLELRITTTTWPELAAIAQQVKEQWEQVGARVTVETLPISQLQEVIRDRTYQILLFGEILSPDPDPFSFWHSSQREGLGQNLSVYSNTTADRLLEEARQTLNPLERARIYDEFQRVLLEDIPAIFLYSPHYLYALDSDVEGFATELISLPSDRFAGVVDWYVKTKRTFR